ncbi:hypothetical protein CCHR01_04889 [Colletotrichum chrysophilum]|uniref:Uncharacterized protein n=1 Tax=Colletotrichum chrysophilum TaxID=1836956 RepID=A0AAD9AS12_9PEZI|nr:hypothetical protein CCHR01_04889 [Colletotrichum chrysophilum]
MREPRDRPTASTLHHRAGNRLRFWKPASGEPADGYRRPLIGLVAPRQPKSGVDKASSERGQTAQPLPGPAGHNPSARTQPRDRPVNPPSAANSSREHYNRHSRCCRCQCALGEKTLQHKLICPSNNHTVVCPAMASTPTGP